MVLWITCALTFSVGEVGSLHYEVLIRCEGPFLSHSWSSSGSVLELFRSYCVSCISDITYCYSWHYFQGGNSPFDCSAWICVFISTGWSFCSPLRWLLQSLSWLWLSLMITHLLYFPSGSKPTLGLLGELAKHCCMGIHPQVGMGIEHSGSCLTHVIILSSPGRRKLLLFSPEFQLVTTICREQSSQSIRICSRVPDDLLDPQAGLKQSKMGSLWV